MIYGETWDYIGDEQEENVELDLGEKMEVKDKDEEEENEERINEMEVEMKDKKEEVVEEVKHILSLIRQKIILQISETSASDY